jgi:cell division protein FtsQ
MFELLFVLCLIGVFGYFFIDYTKESNEFDVRNIQINGLQRLSQEEILAVTEIDPSDNVLYLDIEAIKEKIEQLPYVKNCQVTQIFPNTVNIDIVERVPFASIHLNSRAYAIDDEGVILREYTSSELPIPPFITITREIDFVNLGEEIQSESLDTAIQILTHLKDTPLADSITIAEVAIQSKDEIIMICEELHYEIRWGYSSPKNQVDRWNIYWLANQSHPPCNEYLDLRFEPDLVCK